MRAISLFLLSFGLAHVASGVVIDDFSNNHAAVGDPPGANATSVAAAAAIGGRRGLAATLLPTPGGPGPVGASISGGVFTFGMLDTTPNSRGEVVVTWDGDTLPNTLSFFGTPQDLTAMGHRSLRIRVNSADAGAEIVFEVYTDANNSSLASLRLFPSVNVPTDFYLSYGPGGNFVPRLGSGANFASVGAIVMTVRGTETSALIDLIDTVGPTVAATKRDLDLANSPIAAALAPNTTFKHRVVINNTGGAAVRANFNDVNTDPNLTLNPATANATPIAANDGYATFGNVPLTVTAAGDIEDCDPVGGVGLLANDCDPDTNGANPSLTVTTVGAIATALGGSANVSADGSFTYTPPTGVGNAVDTFTYTVADNDSSTANATVSIAIGPRIWFVDDAHGGTNVGTRDNPFVGLTATNVAGTGGAGDLDAARDIIYLYSGAYPTLASGLPLEVGQSLWGGGDALQIDGVTIVAAGVAPTITNAGGSGVVLATGGNHTIRGLTIGNTTVSDIVGSNFGTLTTSNVTLSGGGGALDLDNGVLAATFSSVASTAGTNGIDLDTVTGTVSFGSTTLAGITGTGIRVNASTATVNFGATTVGAANATNLTNNGGSVLNFSSLALTSSAGAGLLASTSGTLNISGASNTISATGGAAVDLTSTNLGSGATFSTVSSSGSPGDGINLDTVTGSFIATGGSISTAAGIDFDLNAGNATVTYAGSITNTTNRSVEITGRTGGTVTLSVTISDTGTGINVANNTGGTINFSGATKTLNTGANTAVTLATNNGATINFTGGGLDIDTTSGIGFNATGGAAAITVQGSNNSISSTTGTALNVASSTIGAAGLTFQSIASNGGGNAGIVLNTTGASGGLTVAGSGSPGSGGTIQNKTVDGVTLQNTRLVSLSRMIINNNDNNGIFGDDLTDFSLIDSTVSNNGDLGGGTEGDLRFNELLGTCVISGSTIFGGIADGIRMTPASGTLTSLTISGSTIGPITAGNGIAIVSSGTAVVNVTLNSSTMIKNIFASGFLTTINGTSLNVNVNNVTFQDNNIGFDLGNGVNSDVTATVTNSTFLRHTSNAFNLVTDAGSTNAASYRATISNNTIGDTNLDSGSVNTFGIAGDFRGDVDAVVSITNNTIRHTDQDGIFIQGRLDDDADGEVGLLDLTVRDNTVSNIDDNSAFPFGALYGIRVEARNTYNLCLDIFSNASTSVGGLEHFRVRQRDTSTFRVERLALGAQNAAATQAHVAAQNDAGSTANATVATNFTGVADGTCRTP